MKRKLKNARNNGRFHGTRRRMSRDSDEIVHYYAWMHDVERNWGHLWPVWAKRRQFLECQAEPAGICKGQSPLQGGSGIRPAKPAHMAKPCVGAKRPKGVWGLPKRGPGGPVGRSPTHNEGETEERSFGLITAIFPRFAPFLEFFNLASPDFSLK